MQTIDLIILVFIAILVILDFRKGLIISLATLAGLMLGIYLAIHFSNFIGNLLIKNPGISGAYVPLLSFTITFLAVILGVLLLGKLVEKLVDLAGMGLLNHLAGAFFGLVKGLLILSVVFYVISRADPGEKLISPKAKQESLFYKHCAWIFPSLMRWTGAQMKTIQGSL